MAKILIVEDNPANMKLACLLLLKAGHAVVCASDAETSLTLACTEQPDLILMDMYMPGCTGVEVTRVVRQHAEFLSTPVVYLSADTNVALQVDALRLGGDVVQPRLRAMKNNLRSKRYT